MNFYQPLIEKTITTVTVDFTTMMIHKGEKWRFIPPYTTVFIPLDYAGVVTMPNFLLWFLGKEKAKLNIEPPIPKGHEIKEHYLYQLHHGYDYSHHREPLESSMLIEKEPLDKLTWLESVDPRTSFYKAIEYIYPRIIKLDESSISWHDEEILTRVKASR